MEDQERAKQQAEAQLNSIKKMVKNLIDSDYSEEAYIQIQEDALSVGVRSDWQSPSENLTPSEYNILLCTGGPAVRIIGEIGEYQEPITAKIEYQDWFTSWEELNINSEDEESLLEYARQYIFAY